MKSDRQIAIIGLGALGMALVKSLAKEGAHVIAVDDRMDNVEEVKHLTFSAVCFDATDVRQLKMHGFTEVDVAVVAIGEKFDSTVIVAMELLNSGVKEVYARATSDIQEQILRRIGVTEILNPEKQLGERMGISLHRSGLKDLLELGDGQSIFEIIVPKSMNGFTLKELELRRRFGINVLSVNRLEPAESNSKTGVYKSIGFTTPDSKILTGDKMIVLGGIDECSKLIALN
jgi:trk system potassium uptake protein